MIVAVLAVIMACYVKCKELSQLTTFLLENWYVNELIPACTKTRSQLHFSCKYLKAPAEDSVKAMSHRT